MSRNGQTLAAGLKLGVFTLASILVTGLLAAIMGNIGFGAAQEYRAVFTNASMITKGADVRIAGVNVGEVTGVEHHDGTGALIEFRVSDDVQLTTSTIAAVRYLDLVGGRYLALEEGSDPQAETLEPGATIDVDHTQPALDLSTLFNGFAPLFEALDPREVNDLSLNLVRVLQGEGGTVESLLQRTASLTSTLADRDELIGRVITNLDETLTTVDRHREELNRLVLALKDWMTGLSASRQVIGRSVANVADLTDVVAGLLTRSRPLLKQDVVRLERLARLLNQPGSQALLVELLDRLPESMTDQTRTGTYGAWYQYYLCDFSGKITLPALNGVAGLAQLRTALNRIEFHSDAPRCNA